MTSQGSDSLLFEDYPKQFAVFRNGGLLPDVTPKSTLGSWLIYAAETTPVVELFDIEGRQIGSIVGWMIADGRLYGDAERVVVGSRDDFHQSLNTASGRFVYLIEQNGVGTELGLDAGGLMPAVFSPETGIIASTPTIVSKISKLDVDHEVKDIFSFPKRRGFLPFGLTQFIGVKRLLPNHKLNLDTWEIKRSWPFDDIENVYDEATARERAVEIANLAQKNVDSISRGKPSLLYLSGGHDSRMVLAACKKHRKRITCQTSVSGESIDDYIAKKLCSRFKLEHKTLTVASADPSYVRGWLDRTGYTLYDPISELGYTVERNAPSVHPMTGTCAEIVRASNWGADDIEDDYISIDKLLKKLRLPPNERIVDAAENWLNGLRVKQAPLVLDLAKIEQIHGCWAGSALYGHRVSLPSFSPYSSRAIYERALRLPYQYRLSGEVYKDIVAHLWPELMSVPVNEVEGLAKIKFARSSLKKMIPKKVKSALKPFR